MYVVRPVMLRHHVVLATILLNFVSLEIKLCNGEFAEAVKLMFLKMKLKHKPIGRGFFKPKSNTVFDEENIA